MKRVRRNLFRVVCALVGALAGGLLTMGAAALTDAEPRPDPPARFEVTPSAERPAKFESDAIPKEPSTVAPKRTVLLAWAPGGLPANTQIELERTRGVRAVATIEAGLDWIESSRSPDGTVLDHTPGGMAIPFENAYVNPADYAEFVSPADRDKVRSLDEGETLIPRTSEDLRGGGTGVVLRLQSGSLTVTGVVDDVTTGGYEALSAGRAPRRWGVIDRFVLIGLDGRAKTSLVEKRLRSLLEPGQRLRLRPSGVNPFLRYGDAVLPQLIIKASFGEFAARPIPGDRFFEIEESWRRLNIRVATLPVVGEVTCHRSLIPQLRAALKEVVARDLGYTIQPGQYGGCFAPRFVSPGPRHRLSHHAWGIAVDFNVSENPTGIRPNLDRRLVAVMREHGFTWGGDWLVPDGMHFEWVEF
ncbi:MAG: M15 family metallopeptidase [Actinomycetota bacterium]